VLHSAIFTKAPRISQLLRFLVLRDSNSDLSASAIAAEVFGREAGSFDPSIDPIVRVQLGRLRDKLNRYYESVGRDVAIRFDVPIGSCVPSVTWHVPKQSGNPDPATLQFVALKLIGGVDGRSFCRGLNEQLLHELYRVCGTRIAVHTSTAQPPQRRLEGSIRVEPGHLRISVRLIENNSGQLLWAHQVDSCFEHSIRQQEQLAAEICAALQPQP
jgi:hypothetical protein